MYEGLYITNGITQKPLSAILRNKLKPSADFNFNLFAISPQRSLAFVHDSTSKS